MKAGNTHSIVVGYIAWIFGFMGAHRFYYGKKLTGLLWFFTCGLFLIGWIIDLFLIPAMDEEADGRFTEGSCDYSLAWILLGTLGIFGVHRMYMGKWISAIIYLCTLGIFGLGILYDIWSLNDQVEEINDEESYERTYGYSYR